MKKPGIVLVLFIALTSCGGDSSGNNAASGNDTDTAGLTNPTAIDTTKHPTGMDNSNVISTDTAAMNTSNAYKKLDSARKKTTSSDHYQSFLVKHLSSGLNHD